jgi:hypothetical protein
MGFVMDVDATNNILRVTLDGHLTDAILFDGYAAMGKYLAQHPSCHSIGDFSPVVSADLSGEAIRQLAAAPPLPTAAALRILVAPPDSVYGMARMFQILGEETRPNLHIVRTMDEAYSLLQVKSPEFSPLS